VIASEFLASCTGRLPLLFFRRLRDREGWIFKKTRERKGPIRGRRYEIITFHYSGSHRSVTRVVTTSQGSERKQSAAIEFSLYLHAALRCSSVACLQTESGEGIIEIEAIARSRNQTHRVALVLPIRTRSRHFARKTSAAPVALLDRAAVAGSTFSLRDSSIFAPRRDFHRNTCARNMRARGVESVKIRAADPPTPGCRARASSACGCSSANGGGRRSRSSCARRYSIIGPHLRRAQSDRYLFVIRDLACTIRSWQRALPTRHARAVTSLA